MAPGQLLVAFSGGRDSTVLLHALHALSQAGHLSAYRLQALHVHHGLHAEADAWADHCARFAAQLSLPFAVERLEIVRRPGDGGEEEVARIGRYDALRRHLEPNGRLLTAHHGDDQLETLLLALTRGAGVQGLAAMGSVQPFAEGWHVRPLLAWTRERVAAYAEAAQLTFIEDPANADPAYARSYLRHQVLPALRARWPGIAGAVLRSAAHCATAAANEDALAAVDAGAALATLERLPIGQLSGLSSHRQRNVLRAWCRARGHRPPPQRRLEQGLEDLLTSGPDALPCLAWDAVQLRRYRDHLYLTQAPREVQAPADASDPLALPAGLGRLSVTPVPPGVGRARVAAHRWRAEAASVRFRAGGERLRLPGREGSRSLKHLLQEWGVVPWMRSCLPLVYQADQLVAVADLAVTEAFAADTSEAALELRWEHGPTVF